MWILLHSSCSAKCLVPLNDLRERVLGFGYWVKVRIRIRVRVRIRIRVRFGEGFRMMITVSKGF